MQNKIEWLSIMRGLNILLVVVAHAQLIDISSGKPFYFFDELNTILVAIRMPLFVFCSGGLLYLSRISKKWTIRNLLIDKVQRLLCPFIFFVILYYIIKIIMNDFVKTEVDTSFSDFLLSFVVFTNHPSVHLWFLAVLMWFMLLYPLFCWLCQDDKRMIIFLLFTIIIQYFDFRPQDPEKNYFYIFSLNQYLVYFFFGLFFFKYRLYDYLRVWWSFPLTAIIFTLTYYYQLWYPASLTGILLAVSINLQIEKLFPKLFISFREYIYQIYLMSLIFQGIVELIIWRKLCYCPQLVFLFYIINILIGIYVPVIISKMAERTHWRWLHLALGLKKA